MLGFLDSQIFRLLENGYTKRFLIPLCSIRNDNYVVDLGGY
jgi:hypothetical protein